MSGILRELSKRRGVIILVAIGVLGIGLVVYLFTRTREPVYGGKTVTAWIRQLSLNYGSFGVRVSGSGKGGPIRLLRSPGPNPAFSPNPSQYLPDLMQSKSGLTNVYLIDDTPQGYQVLSVLAQMGVLTITNVRVSIGLQTNLVVLPSGLGSVFAPAGFGAAGQNIVLRSPMTPAPGFLPAGFGPAQQRIFVVGPALPTSALVPASFGTASGNIFMPGPVKPAPGLNLIHVDPAFIDARKPKTALQAIGAPALPYLERALLQQNRPFHSAYLKLYSRLSQWAGRWLPEPAVDAVFTRRAAANAFTQIRTLGQPSSLTLLAALKDPDISVRSMALHALDKRSEQDPAIVPALTKAMMALPAAEFFENGLTGPATVQRLTALLKERDARLRAEAVSELRRIGPKAGAAIPTLVLRLQDEDRTVRARTCEAVGWIDAVVGRQPQGEVVISALIQALADPDHWVRRNAAENLGLYKARAKAALPRLWTLRDATNAVERYCVRKALKQIDPDAAQKAGIN